MGKNNKTQPIHMLKFGIATLFALSYMPEANATRLFSKDADEADAAPQGEGSNDAGEYPEPIALAQSMAAQAFRSETWNEPVNVLFSNESKEAVELFWHDYSGNEVSYGTIAAGGTKRMHTYATHPWSATGPSGAFTVDAEAVWVPVAADTDRVIYIDDHQPEYRSKTWNEAVPLTF